VPPPRLRAMTRIASPTRRAGIAPATLGLLLYLLAILVMSVMDLIAKTLSADLPVVQLLWARYTGQTLIVLLVLAPRLALVARSHHPWGQALRSSFLLAGTTFFFLSFSRLGLAEATALMDVNPVFITIGAALFLGEKVGPHRVVGIAAALIGALIIIRPGTSVFSPAALLPLAGAAAYAGFALTSRRIGQADGVWTSMLYAGLLGAVVLSLIVPTAWVMPDRRLALLMLAIGLVGGTGQFLMIRAFMLAEASAVAPLSYVGLLFAAFWGWLVFGEIPDAATWAGAAVIVSAGIYIWHRETRRPRR